MNTSGHSLLFGLQILEFQVLGDYRVSSICDITLIFTLEISAAGPNRNSSWTIAEIEMGEIKSAEIKLAEIESTLILGI